MCLPMGIAVCARGDAVRIGPARDVDMTVDDCSAQSKTEQGFEEEKKVVVVVVQARDHTARLGRIEETSWLGSLN